MFRLILRNSALLSAYKDILAPLIYYIFIFFVPIIRTLINMEQNNFISELQGKLISLLLFFKTFLATIVNLTWCLKAKETAKP